MVSHVLGDGRLTHGNPELHKLAMYSGRTPERIRGGQLANQGANVWWHAGAPGAMAALPGPEQTKTAPVPRDHGFRLDDLNGRAPAAPRLREPRPQYPVSWRESKTWAAASIDDGELVSECDAGAARRVTES
jgi:hypothetical protein